MLIRVVYRKLKTRVKELFSIVKTYKVRTTEIEALPPGSVMIWGIPEHGNLGDQAITYAEVSFIERYCPERDIFMVPEQQCIEYIYPLIRLAARKGFIIISHGGGNMGGLYKYQEGLRLMLVRHIKNNSVIVFPQSIDYQEGEHGLERARRIYEGNPRVGLYARERNSYEKMSVFFKHCEVHLVPDIVTSLDRRSHGGVREGVLFCVRADKEKDQRSKRDLKAIEDRIRDVEITYVDTYQNEFAGTYDQQREKLEVFWDKVRGSRLVITDRLHGMIFAMITDTPCVAFDNLTGKISSFYKTWFSDVEGIHLFEGDLGKTEGFIKGILDSTHHIHSYKDMSDHFIDLKKALIQAVDGR